MPCLFAQREHVNVTLVVNVELVLYRGGSDGASLFELGCIHVAYSEMPDLPFAAELSEHLETFADRRGSGASIPPTRR